MRSRVPAVPCPPFVLHISLPPLPALQSSLMGASLMLPVQHGRLALGTWQGIYLNEHRCVAACCVLTWGPGALVQQQPQRCGAVS